MVDIVQSNHSTAISDSENFTSKLAAAENSRLADQGGVRKCGRNEGANRSLSKAVTFNDPLTSDPSDNNLNYFTYSDTDGDLNINYDAQICPLKFLSLFQNQTFVDYFNVYLHLPVFAQHVTYQWSSAEFLIQPPLPSHLDFNDCLTQDRIFDWCRIYRYPFFINSDLYQEYRLSCLLRSEKSFFYKPYISGDCAELDSWSQLQEFLLGSVKGMKRFRQSLSGTSGNNLYVCWMLIQKFWNAKPGTSQKQDLEDYIKRNFLRASSEKHLSDWRSKIGIAGYLNFDIFPRGFLNSNWRAKDLFPNPSVNPFTLNNDNLFLAIENIIYIALKNYWLPRYILHVLVTEDQSELVNYVQYTSHCENITYIHIRRHLASIFKEEFESQTKHPEDYYRAHSFRKSSIIFDHRDDDPSKSSSDIKVPSILVGAFNSDSQTDILSEKQSIDSNDTLFNLMNNFGFADSKTDNREGFVGSHPDPQSEANEKPLILPGYVENNFFYSTCLNEYKKIKIPPYDRMNVSDTQVSSYYPEGSDLAEVHVKCANHWRLYNAKDLAIHASPDDATLDFNVQQLKLEHKDDPSLLDLLSAKPKTPTKTPSEEPTVENAIESDCVAGHPFAAYLKKTAPSGVLSNLRLFEYLNNLELLNTKEIDANGDHVQDVHTQRIISLYLEYCCPEHIHLTEFVLKQMKEGLNGSNSSHTISDYLHQSYQDLKKKWKKFCINERSTFLNLLRWCVTDRDNIKYRTSKSTTYEEKEQPIEVLSDRENIKNQLAYKLSRISLSHVNEQISLADLHQTRKNEQGSLFVINEEIAQEMEPTPPFFGYEIMNQIKQYKIDIENVKIGRIFLYEEEKIPETYIEKQRDIRSQQEELEKAEKTSSDDFTHISISNQSSSVAKTKTKAQQKSQPKKLKELISDPKSHAMFTDFLASNGAGRDFEFVNLMNSMKQIKQKALQTSQCLVIHDMFFGKKANYGKDIHCTHPAVKALRSDKAITPAMMFKASSVMYDYVTRKWFPSFTSKMNGEKLNSEAIILSEEFLNQVHGLNMLKIDQKWQTFFSLVIGFLRGFKSFYARRLFYLYILHLLQNHTKNTSKMNESVSPDVLSLAGDVNIRSNAAHGGFTYPEVVVTVKKQRIILNKVPEDSEFWLESQRYKYLVCHYCNRRTSVHTIHPSDRETLKSKARAIVKCFLSSDIPPQLRINAPNGMVKACIEQAQNRYPTKSLFQELANFMFTHIYHLWSRFLHEWHPDINDKKQLIKMYKIKYDELRYRFVRPSPHSSQIFFTADCSRPIKQSRLSQKLYSNEGTNVSFTLEHGIMLEIPAPPNYQSSNLPTYSPNALARRMTRVEPSMFPLSSIKHTSDLSINSNLDQSMTEYSLLPIKSGSKITKNASVRNFATNSSRNLAVSLELGKKVSKSKLGNKSLNNTNDIKEPLTDLNYNDQQSNDIKKLKRLRYDDSNFSCNSLLCANKDVGVTKPPLWKDCHETCKKAFSEKDVKARNQILASNVTDMLVDSTKNGPIIDEDDRIYRKVFINKNKSRSFVSCKSLPNCTSVDQLKSTLHTNEITAGSNVKYDVKGNLKTILSGCSNDNNSNRSLFIVTQPSECIIRELNKIYSTLEQFSQQQQISCIEEMFSTIEKLLDIKQMKDSGVIKLFCRLFSGCRRKHVQKCWAGNDSSRTYTSSQDCNPSERKKQYWACLQSILNRPARCSSSVVQTFLNDFVKWSSLVTEKDMVAIAQSWASLLNDRVHCQSFHESIENSNGGKTDRGDATTKLHRRKKTSNEVQVRKNSSITEDRYVSLAWIYLLASFCLKNKHGQINTIKPRFENSSSKKTDHLLLHKQDALNIKDTSISTDDHKTFRNSYRKRISSAPVRLMTRPFSKVSSIEEPFKNRKIPDTIYVT